MTYRGPWKWLRAPRRKRRKVEVEEIGGQDEEDMGIEAEDEEEDDMWIEAEDQDEEDMGIEAEDQDEEEDEEEEEEEGMGGGIEGGWDGGGGQGGWDGGGGHGGWDGGGGQGDVFFLEDVPQPIIWGRRSHLDGVAWTCDCQHTNHPSRELFVDLPAFYCTNCNAERRIDFRFSFGNLAANEECPIGEILYQGQANDCLLFALAKGAEITDRMREILSGSDLVIPTLDPFSLKEICVASGLFEGGQIKLSGDEALGKMFHLMQTVGIQDAAREHTCRIGGVEQVQGYFEDIVRELAKGYPLMVDIMPGKEFGHIKYHEVYRCPFNNRTIKAGSKVMMHTVLLVGAARLGKLDYFYFLNSYGEWWCVRVHRHTKHQIGGIGKLVADDICCQPYKFLRIVQP